MSDDGLYGEAVAAADRITAIDPSHGYELGGILAELHETAAGNHGNQGVAEDYATIRDLASAVAVFLTDYKPWVGPREPRPPSPARLNRLYDAAMVLAEQIGAVDARRGHQLRAELDELHDTEAGCRPHKLLVDAYRAISASAAAVVTFLTEPPNQEEPRSDGPAVASPTPSITCPKCRKSSTHPRDIEQGYCGRCHDWTGQPAGGRHGDR